MIKKISETGIKGIRNRDSGTGKSEIAIREIRNRKSEIRNQKSEIIEKRKTDIRIRKSVIRKRKYRIKNLRIRNQETQESEIH